MAVKQAGAFTALQVPVFDKEKGTLSYTWLKQFQQWQRLLAGGFDPSGTLISNISPNVKIVGRLGTIGTILQHISDVGVIDGAGMTPATSTEQGAVVLPSGATDNVLGSAAIHAATDFDPAGAAAVAAGAAQTAAEAYAGTVSASAAATAQSNAEAYASNASNITSGNLNLARIPGLAGTTTITTAALTVGGTQGSMTFENGVLTAQTPAT